MKRRCVPLRADHDLLTPDTHARRSGVRLHPGRSGGVASTLANQSDSSSSESAVRASQRQRPPVEALPRRLRFEDETETEAESRYLERQQQRRRRGGPRGSALLVSKPELYQFANSNMGKVPQNGRPRRAEPQGVGHMVGERQEKMTFRGQSGLCECQRSISGDGANLNLHRHPPTEAQRQRQHRPSLSLRTEPIRETYIGIITHGEIDTGGAKSGLAMDNLKSRSTNQMEANRNHVTASEATPTTDLPLNPYDLKQPTRPTQPSEGQKPATAPYVSPPTTHVTSETKSQSVTVKAKATKNLTQVQCTPERSKEGAELQEKMDCVDKNQEVMNSFVPSSPSGQNLAGSQAPPTPSSSNDGQLGQSIKAELHGEESNTSSHSLIRDESSRLSLRRLFANVKLSRNRAASLDRFSSKHRPSGLDTAHFEPAPSFNRKSTSHLKEMASIQSLHVGAPFFSLRKSSSVTCLRSEKKRKDRSADYKPGADQCIQRSISIDDVGRPSSVQSVGRVLQVCSDGTFLLEISRLKNRTFGFIISRGRGRCDSGVYVDDMMDCSTVKLYSGLLAVGDEIIEVNGENVTCLTLDQVTQLLTQTTTTTIRVLRHSMTSQR